MTKAQNWILGILAFLATLISYRLGRGLWIDEVLQFAVGSYDSTKDAWSVTISTVGGINHGQTGLYFILNYWALKLFGAHNLCIRFPSLLFSFFFFAATAHLYSILKIPFRWRIWGFLLLFANPWFSDFIGEGRPYLPLAACSLGVLSYYLTPLKERKGVVNFFGWIGVLFGVLIHPYFSVYWAVLFLYSIYFHKVSFQKPKEVLSHLNLSLFACGVLGYFGMGLSGWMIHRVHFGSSEDPFFWLPKDVSLPRLLISTHFQSIGKAKGLFVPLLFLVPIFLRSRRKKDFEFESIAVLGAVVLGVSAFLSWVSYRNNYWILQRQWIASIGICLVLSPWFASKLEAVFSNNFKKKWANTINLWFWVLMALTCFETAKLAQFRIQSSFEALTSSHRPFTEAEKKTKPTSNGQWEELARANVREGGPVWPIFRTMYGEPPK
ncbi:MAG: hypothetical protein AB7F43_03880 [Bacteriovoracia bacterium]